MNGDATTAARTLWQCGVILVALLSFAWGIDQLASLVRRRRAMNTADFARFAAEELGVPRRHVQVIDGREVIFRIGVVVPDSALLKLASAIGRRLPGQPVLIDVRPALPASSGRRPFHS